MNLKNSVIVLFLLNMNLVMSMNPQLYEKISSLSTTAYEVYKEFNNLSIPAFAVDSFKKEGIKKADLDKWAAYAHTANKYVESLINQGKLSNTYQAQIAALNGMLNTIETTATELKMGRITQIRKEELLKKIKSSLQEAAVVEKTSFDKIARQNPPADWVEKANSSKLTLKTDTKGDISYGTLFAEWDKFQGTKGRMINDNDFQNFLKQIGLTNKFTIANIVNTLDYVIYRLHQDIIKLQNDIEKSWFGNDARRKKIESYLGFINKAETISTRIKKIFPTATTLQMAQIAGTNDKPAAILYAQSSIYQIALNKLIKELLSQ